jgi:hypothetical protein
MNDLEQRLRHDAKRFGSTARADLASRILEAVANDDDQPQARKVITFPRRPLALAAGILAVVSIGFLMRSGNTPATPSENPTATVHVPAINWAADWSMPTTTPIDSEFAELSADMQGIGRFLADRLPKLTDVSVN